MRWRCIRFRRVRFGYVRFCRVRLCRLGVCPVRLVCGVCGVCGFSGASFPFPGFRVLHRQSECLGEGDCFGEQDLPLTVARQLSCQIRVDGSVPSQVRRICQQSDESCDVDSDHRQRHPTIRQLCIFLRAARALAQACQPGFSVHSRHERIAQSFLFAARILHAHRVGHLLQELPCGCGFGRGQLRSDPRQLPSWGIRNIAELLREVA
ncbi:hypothetical protein SRABI91_04622 [Rhodococcoides fascians]|nr:hypothetical protein SRABI91_04622 [Rhodococcus fascians]